MSERRRLTVLVCDLMNSTDRHAQRDPEGWWEAVADYHRAAAQSVERYGGRVAQYRGDCVMAYFGWPEAHDNDAERAVRASLAILEATSMLNDHPATLPTLCPRVGLDSGAVAVEASAGRDADLFGEPPAIAARVAAAAAPGMVLATAETHRLVAGLFEVEDRGAQVLEGFQRPVELYQVIRPSGVRGRFQAAAAAGGLTRFVGREDELRSLTSRWESALEGDGQVALIIGEAGIGKSRLVHRFREQIANRPHTWVEAGAGAFSQNTPFYPITEILRQFIGHQASLRSALTDETPDQQLRHLESALRSAELEPAEAIPVLVPLLNLPLPPDYRPLELSPEEQRRRLLATLVEWVLGFDRARPLVIAIEDLHWADPSTLELIQILVEQGAMSSLLLLYTARPEFRAQWPSRAHHTQITLNRLSVHDARTIIDEVTAQKLLPEQTVAAVVERSGGVPLFVEELTQVVLERGADNATHDIPATLHDSLMARLDRLGPAKDVAQVAAVIGRKFSYELLRAMHPIAERDLQRALDGLAAAELVYTRGIVPRADYSFKHALIQDAAYNSLLSARRKQLHERAGQGFESVFAEQIDEHMGELAHHYRLSDNLNKAIEYLGRAGQQALQRSAHAEAIGSLTAAIDLLQKLPDSPERIRGELPLQLALGQAFIVQKGWAAREVEQAFARARDLCERLGDPPELFSALFGLFAMYYLRDEQRMAYQLAKRLLRRAQGTNDPALLIFAHLALGDSSHQRGELLLALEHLEMGISLYNRERHRALTLRLIGLDPGVNCLSYAAYTLWHLGYPEQALERVTEAIARDGTGAGAR
jgi:class 3 adenylate cyclase/tetratricopeptide (TPR) repeat protein